MFFRYIDFIFTPFRAIHNKILGVKSIKGNVQVDARRLKATGQRGKNMVKNAGEKVGVGGQQQQAAGMQQQAGQPPQGYPQPGYPQQGYPAQGYQQGAQQMQPGMPPGMPPGM